MTGGSAEHANELVVGGAVELSRPIVVALARRQIESSQSLRSQFAYFFDHVIFQRRELVVSFGTRLTQFDVTLEAE